MKSFSKSLSDLKEIGIKRTFKPANNPYWNKEVIETIDGTQWGWSNYCQGYNEFTIEPDRLFETVDEQQAYYLEYYSLKTL